MLRGCLENLKALAQPACFPQPAKLTVFCIFMQYDIRPVLLMIVAKRAGCARALKSMFAASLPIRSSEAA